MQAAIDVETAIGDDPAKRARDGKRAVEYRDPERQVVARVEVGEVRHHGWVEPATPSRTMGRRMGDHIALPVFTKAWHSVSTHPAQTDDYPGRAAARLSCRRRRKRVAREGMQVAKKRDVAVLTASGRMPRSLVKAVGLRVAQAGPVEPAEEVDRNAEGEEVDFEFAVRHQLLGALFGRCGCVAALVGGFELAFQAVSVDVVDDVVMFLGGFLGQSFVDSFVEGFFDAALFVDERLFLVERSHAPEGGVSV